MIHLNLRTQKRPRKPAGGSLLGSLRNDVQFTSVNRSFDAMGEPPTRGTRAMAHAIAVASVRRMIV
jgi:hypothetical protein